MPKTGDDVLLVRGDRDHLYGPVGWPEAGRLIYARYTVGKAPDWDNRVDYSSLDPTDPSRAPIPATKDESPARAGYDRRALVPTELREAWTGLFVESPDGSAAVFATSTDAYPYNILYVLDLETGARGVIGAGGLGLWSPVPASGP